MLNRPARFLFAVAAALAAVAVNDSDRASAHGTDVPTHALATSYCGAGRFDAYPPARMDPVTPTDFRNPERVSWSPDLYRWKPRREYWRQVETGPPWYNAWTSSYGYFQTTYTQVWSAAGSNPYYIYFHLFDGLRPGYFKVKHYLFWPALNRTHMMKTTYCEVAAAFRPNAHQEAAVPGRPPALRP